MTGKADTAPVYTVPTGAQRIAVERDRQVAKEGYSSDHDDQHTDGSLAIAAACYAANAAGIRLYRQEAFAAGVSFVDPWPWEQSADARCYGYGGQRGNVLQSPTTDDAIRLLEKAGALIAAEIDVLLRQKARANAAK